MNLRSGYKTGLLLALTINLTLSYAQDFEITPHVTGVTNTKDGFLEMGPLISIDQWEFKPYLRIPITNKERSIAQVDKSSNSFNGGLSFSYILDFTEENDCTIRQLYLTGQVEAGTKLYKYYPDSTSTSEIKEHAQSFAGEFKAGYYRMKGNTSAKQVAPEFRIRYSRDVRAADEVGIVLDNPNGISTVQNLITGEPLVTSAFSPAICLNFYSGKGQFSYTPAFYYYFTGEQGDSNPFNNISRMRIEAWIYYYPLISGKVVKLGLSPFLSARTSGEDSQDKYVYGIMFQLLVGKNMLNFF